MYEELQKEIAKVKASVLAIQKNPALPDHFHNGTDTSRILWSDLSQRKLYINHTIYGTGAATGTNYGVFYIVPVACVVTKIQEVHQTAGSDAGAVTLDIEKLTGTQAIDGGAGILATTFSLKATADTVQTGTITATSTSRTLAVGDRLAMKDAGTLTAVANVTVLIELTII